MTDFSENVVKWIENNYDTTTIDISDYHLPSSKVIKLRDGMKRLIYWDYMKNKIIEREF
ncbi:MAG: hypothetical protein ABF289_00995 [Clostridiales bacterium]